VVQDLKIGPLNTLYRLERWESPKGEYLVGKLPGEVKGHFGPGLISFCLYQYYHAHVTQPLLLEELREFGIDISAGQINRILMEGKERFHREKEEILRAGLGISRYINVDDTGARHQGNNGYCTHIGNEFFAWFRSTDSKSRVNFLKILRGEHEDYVLNQEAFEYIEGQKMPTELLERLKSLEPNRWDNESEWKETLKKVGISEERHVRIATEGALLGSVLEHGLNPEMVIVSDDAGQFNLLRHALCWFHADRSINNLVSFNEEQHQAIEGIRVRIWELYNDLKAYKEAPSEGKKVELEQRFDEIFTTLELLCNFKSDTKAAI